MGKPDCMPASSIRANRAAYERRAVVRRYAAHSHLQPPEQAVLEMLGPRLGEMRMLDIGVGAGRTTLHFAPLVREYVGIDYAESMIEACRRRFPDAGPGVSFETRDAREMRAFGDASFDFVLFSFNGLDHLDHDGRIEALGEIRRVLAPAGTFCFSAHNLLSVPRLFAFPWSHVAKRPWLLGSKLVKWVLLHRLNRPLHKLLAARCATINDGAHAFRLRTHYIRPTEQVHQLGATGYADVRIFTLDGNEAETGDGLDQLEDSWLYYLCGRCG
jgi:SAM-dependent methyltransferase